MHTLSLSGVTLDLSHLQVKLLLIALDSLHRNLENETTRQTALENIHKAEVFFNFEIDSTLLYTDLHRFTGVIIGCTCDDLFEAHYEYADSLGLLKPLPEEIMANKGGNA